MQINPINPVFAEFNTISTNTKDSNFSEPQKEIEIDRKLLLSMIGLGTLGVALLGVSILKRRHADKKIFSIPKDDFTKAAPELVRIKPEDYIIKPKKQARRILKVADTADGKKLKIQEYRTGSLSECFDDAGKFLYRERQQTIERPDGFSDKLNIMTLDDGKRKKTFGVMKVFRGYEEEEIGITKEFIKNKKGKWTLERREATFADDMHENVNKIVEHLTDGTTRVTLIKKSYNTKEIKIYDKKGNIISSSMGFL